jgi:hypothetical protein
MRTYLSTRREEGAKPIVGPEGDGVSYPGACVAVITNHDGTFHEYVVWYCRVSVSNSVIEGSTTNGDYFTPSWSDRANGVPAETREALRNAAYRSYRSRR